MDSPMPAKIRFPKGVHSPVSLDIIHYQHVDKVEVDKKNECGKHLRACVGYTIFLNED